MSYANVRLEIDGALATLTVDRPKALNALDGQTLDEIGAAACEVAGKKGVRALIVTGAGEKAFVAGADIAAMAEMSAAEGAEFSGKGHRAFQALEALEIPTIAAVNGFALGGGLELALGCDLIYVSEKAKLGFPEVGLSVIPGFGGTQRLARRVGPSRAMELMFTGEMIKAEEAVRIGLALRVLPPEELMAHCRKQAETIATKGPLAIASAKRVMRIGASMDLVAGCELERVAFGNLFGTEDQREGMAAFLEKRTPSFKGR